MNCVLRMTLLGLLLPSMLQAMETVPLYGDESYPPYSYVEDGEFKGIYVDFLRRVSESMPSFRLELKPIPWKRGLSMLKTGEALALFPPYQFTERAYMVPYSVPLNTERVIVLCDQRVMSKPRSQFPADFAEVVIGINRGFLLTEQWQRAAHAGQLKIEEAASNEVNLRKLAAGRIACYANDQLAVQFELRKMQADPKVDVALKTLVLLEAVELSTRTAHIGFSAYNNPTYKAEFINQLNAAIVSVKKTKLMEKLIEDYAR